MAEVVLTPAQFDAFLASPPAGQTLINISGPAFYIDDGNGNVEKFLSISSATPVVIILQGAYAAAALVARCPSVVLVAVTALRRLRHREGVAVMSYGTKRRMRKARKRVTLVNRDRVRTAHYEDPVMRQISDMMKRGR